MIKKLRYKFLAVTMLCIGLLFAAILLSINLYMTFSSQKQGYDMLERISALPRPDREEGSALPPSGSDSSPEGKRENRGELATRPFTPDTGRQPANYLDAFRVFHISYDKEGNLLDVSYNQQSGLTEEDILQLGEKMWQKNPDAAKERGIVQSKYLYLIRDRGAFRQVYFLDYSMERAMTNRLFYLCLFVGLIGMLVLFAVAFLLSGWMIKPVQNAFEKQKQFIADASHELKTPLTIINANAEVLLGSLGENKWLLHILEQAQRMNVLIRDLLDLAKLDASENTPDFSEFDLSRAVSSAALSFESLAFETRKTYQMYIEENLTYCGSEQAVRQLVTILLDNAFKYSNHNGSVTIRLTAKGKSGERISREPSKKILTVRNTGSGIAPEDQKHIFERFYRSDDSRSRESGGYGLGLSIAASIARTHKARISVQSDGQSYTQITVIF